MSKVKAAQLVERFVHLNKLEKDCVRVSERIAELLAADAVAQQHNRKAASYGWAAFLLSLLAPAVLVAVFLHRSGAAASMALRELRCRRLMFRQSAS